jgi:hypothetical protein
MSDDIGPLAVWAVQHWGHHHGSLSHSLWCFAQSRTEDSRATALKHLPRSCGAIEVGPMAVAVSPCGIGQHQVGRGEGGRNNRGAIPCRKPSTQSKGLKVTASILRGGNVEVIEPRRPWRHVARDRASRPSMRRLSDTDTRPGGVEDDGDPVPPRHQSDVSQTGNAPYATDSQAQVRLVAPWHA